MKKSIFWVGGIILVGIIIAVILMFVLKKPIYEVSFMSDGSKVLDSIEVKEDGTIEEPSAPVKEGYEFIGWYSGTEKFDFSTKITEDISLEARWEKTVSAEVSDDEETEKEKVDFTLSKTKVTLNVGKSTTIKVTTDSKKKVSWKTSNEKVVTVKDGKITAKSVGKAVVTVTIDGVSKTVNVTVVKNSAVTTTKKVEESITKKTEETTTKVDVLDYVLEENKDSNVGQAVLYLTKNGEKVNGTCTIITTTGEKVVNVSISSNGYVTNAGLIKSVTDIKVK